MFYIPVLVNNPRLFAGIRHLTGEEIPSGMRKFRGSDVESGERSGPKCRNAPFMNNCGNLSYQEIITKAFWSTVTVPDTLSMEREGSPSPTVTERPPCFSPLMVMEPMERTSSF